MPQSDMAAERRMLERLKMTPPAKASPILFHVVCCRSGINERPSAPMLPNVNAEISENIKTPIT